MRKITDIGEIQEGMVILTGTAYILVTDADFPGKFRGKMWVEMSKAWGRAIDVPFPSPTYVMYEVPAGLFL